jgi:hypothetical protein
MHRRPDVDVNYQWTISTATEIPVWEVMLGNITPYYG